MELCESLGYTTTDFDGYAGHAEIGEGEQTIGILGHIDTVPLGDGWELDPCSGALVEGRIYGRGVMDDKGPTLACIYAVKALQRAGVPLTKRIRVIMGLDEESGWDCMEHYLPLAGEPDLSFTPDGAFPVIFAEKGILNISIDGSFGGENPDGVTVLEISGGSRSNVVPDKCTARVRTALDMEETVNKWNAAHDEPIELSCEGEDYILFVKGISAHGSTPEKGLSAAKLMMQFLTSLPLCEELDGAARFYLDRMTCPKGENLGCAMSDDISGHLSFNVGVIRYDGQKLSMVVNIRYPIDRSVEQVCEAIDEGLKGSGYALTRLSYREPLYVDRESDLVKKLMKAYTETTGDRDHSPVAIGGGTYARAVKNAVAFGPIFPGHVEVGHQKNEWAAVEDLMLCMKVYAYAIAELLKD